MFEELTLDASLTRIEEEARRFWVRHGIRDKAFAACKGGPAYTIAQQPLMAGQSPAERARLLAHADLLARYRRMRGDDVRYQLGRVGHGLAVEVAVEQASEPALRDYDLEGFTAACRAADAEQVRHDEDLISRLGVWVDPGDLYTAAPPFMPKVWAALRRLWDAGQLRREMGVAPVCPRCATPLSAAEASRRTVEGEGQAVWVMLPWSGDARRGDEHGYLLIFAPAPWMLLGMVAVAAHPAAEYVLVEVPRGKNVPPARLVVAEAAWERALHDEQRAYRLLRRLPAKALRNTRYRPLFTFLPAAEGGDRVILSDTVPLDTGTGLMPVVPGFDAASLALALEHRLPVPDISDPIGRLEETVTPWRGLAPPDAEPHIVQHLQARGLLLRKQAEHRAGAACPYCGTRLFPLAQPLWLAGSWIVGRDRAWGTPLPVWTCGECGHAVCVAGLDELAGRAGVEVSRIDPYRPAIDRLVLPCERCGGTMRRVPPVLDANFEAAVLPGAVSTQPGAIDLAIGLGDRHIGWLGDLNEAAAMLRNSLGWSQAIALPEGEALQGLADPRSGGDALRWSLVGGAPQDAAGPPLILQQAWSLAFASEGAPGDEHGAGWLRMRLLHGQARVSDALDACDVARAAREIALLIEDMAGWHREHPGEMPPDLVVTASRLMAPFLPHVAEAIYQLAISGNRPADTNVASVHLAGWPQSG